MMFINRRQISFYLDNECMTQISKRKISYEILYKLFDLLYNVFPKNDKQDFLNILSDLFSETERIMFIKRVAVLYLIQRGKARDEICETLKVSTSTVSKYKFLISHSKALIPQLNKIIQNDNLHLTLEEIFISLLGPGSYGTN